MKVKITELGVLLMYPYPGNKSLFHTVRQYYVEDEIGRLDVIEEVDEDEITTDEYTMPGESVEKIFSRPVELPEEEW